MRISWIAFLVFGIISPVLAKTNPPLQAYELFGNKGFEEKPAPPDARTQDNISEQDTQSKRMATPVPPQHGALIRNILYTTGQLHYLHILCYGSSDQAWRSRAERILEKETQKPGPRRDQLIDTFNKGYHDAEKSYAFCTDEEKQAMVSLARDGEKLTNMLTGLQDKN